MGLDGIIFAIEAGICAALASVSAKLATCSETDTFVTLGSSNYLPDGFQYTGELTLAVRFVCVAGIFLFNAIMWVLFTKSMHKCSSTLEATAFNISSNFISTAAFGQVLFGEHLGMIWCLGTVLIIIGLTVLHKESNVVDIDENKHSQDKINKQKLS